ncbi:MAG: nucleoside-diphosphate kinase [Myxococcota bacterium]
MATEQTFAIIKPDAVKSGYTGKILDQIEANGFTIKCMKKVHLTKAQAEGFYYVHRERGFFGELTAFMSSAPCVVMILEKDNAILAWRDLMGPTNPKGGSPLNQQFGKNIGENATHGSDAPETAAFETAYFFSCFERV